MYAALFERHVRSKKWMKRWRRAFCSIIRFSDSMATKHDVCKPNRPLLDGNGNESRGHVNMSQQLTDTRELRSKLATEDLSFLFLQESKCSFYCKRINTSKMHCRFKNFDLRSKSKMRKWHINHQRNKWMRIPSVLFEKNLFLYTEQRLWSNSKTGYRKKDIKAVNITSIALRKMTHELDVVVNIWRMHAIGLQYLLYNTRQCRSYDILEQKDWSCGCRLNRIACVCCQVNYILNRHNQLQNLFTSILFRYYHEEIFLFSDENMKAWEVRPNNLFFVVNGRARLFTLVSYHSTQKVFSRASAEEFFAVCSTFFIKHAETQWAAGLC